MALIPPNQTQVAHQSGDAHRFAVITVRGVNTNDTVDLDQVFARIVSAFFVSLSGGTVGANATINGTVCTITNAGLVADAGYLVAIGSAAR